MDSLTELQRRILAVLEEAGEDDVSALTNSVTKRRGSADEIDAMSMALVGLINCNLIDIARSKDNVSLHWIPLPKEASLALLTDLKPFFQWSVQDQLWKWRQDASRAEVVLTDAGLIAARKILSEDDWPRAGLIQ